MNERFAPGGKPRYHGEMKWLLHGNLTPVVGDALKRHEQDVPEAASLGLTEGLDAAHILELARKHQCEVLTADAAMAQAPFALDLWFNRSMVYLQCPQGEEEQDNAIDRLFERYKRLTPGRLYTVTGSKVKVRQLPAKKV